MKKISFLVLLFCGVNGDVNFYHGAGLELTENGVGAHYEPILMMHIPVYARAGLHFERSNVNLIQYPMYTESPGYQKTILSLLCGSGGNILKGYFADNLRIGIFAEGGAVLPANAIQDFEVLELDYRLIAGIGLQFPGNNSIRKIEIAFQNPNRISGFVLIRFRVTWHKAGHDFG